MKHTKYANEGVIILGNGKMLSPRGIRYEFWVTNIIGQAVYKGNYEIIEYLLENLEKPDLEYGAKILK